MTPVPAMPAGLRDPCMAPIYAWHLGWDLLCPLFTHRGSLPAGHRHVGAWGLWQPPTCPRDSCAFQDRLRSPQAPNPHSWDLWGAPSPPRSVTASPAPTGGLFPPSLPLGTWGSSVPHCLLLTARVSPYMSHQGLESHPHSGWPARDAGCGSSSGFYDTCPGPPELQCLLSSASGLPTGLFLHYGKPPWEEKQGVRDFALSILLCGYVAPCKDSSVFPHTPLPPFSFSHHRQGKHSPGSNVCSE